MFAVYFKSCQTIEIPKMQQIQEVTKENNKKFKYIYEINLNKT